MAKEKVEPAVRSFASAEDFLAWLAVHHDTPEGIWLRIAKRASGVASVTYAGALDAALRYGWIDGQKRAEDAAWFRQHFVPRRRRSVWSRINRDAAERLIAAGLMCPSGQREVDAAKADGRWAAAYEGQRTAQVPDDFLAALKENAAAAAFYEGLDKVNRFAIVFRLQTAKTPATRAKRMCGRRCWRARRSRRTPRPRRSAR